MPPEILCIDLDGPIINCEKRYYEVYKDIVINLCGDPIPKEEYWNKKRNRISEENILKQSNVKINDFDHFRDMKISLIEEEKYLEMDSLHKDSRQLLKNMKSVFGTIILITLRRNNIALEKQLNKFNIRQYFDFILSGFNNEIPPWKVKVDLFHTVISADDLSILKGSFIGDTETDILAGKQLGFKTIAVLSGIRSKEILEKYNPDYIINDLREFTKLMTC